MKVAVKKRRVIIGLIVTLGVAVSLFIVFLIWQYKRYEKAYEVLDHDTPKLVVLKQFGKPTKVLPCRANTSWDGEPRRQSEICIEEFWYFSHLSPEQWVIGFDKGGRAVSKYHFVSP